MVEQPRKTTIPTSSSWQAQRDICLLAETNFRNQRRRFGIKRDDRRRHTYLLGKTGMGKSTVMENMIIQDIRNGEGVAVVDPHGDLAEKILDFIPSERTNDVIYFNPSDTEYPIAFNVMEAVSPEHKHLVASGMVGVFKKLWADSWGPRLEYVLRNAILALLDYPGSTMLGVMRVLVDKNYRKKVIAKITDPVVRSFWVDEYSNYPQNFQSEAIAPIQNKVGQFLSSAMIRNIVGQVKSTIELREVMDQRKILIMNLSKGRVGEDSSALMGAMMITKIQLAAMSRIDMPEHDRKDFYLYVDEFQNFATESFANILSEARKYRLNLIIGHQYIEQLDETVAAAVFGNVGTMMVFRVGAADAEFLEQEFTPYFLPQDLVNLAKYDVYMKLMIDGVSSNPFSATTLPPLEKDEDSAANRLKVIRVSRERYAKPKDVVEEKIVRWSSGISEEEENDAPPRPVTRTLPSANPTSIAPPPPAQQLLDPTKNPDKKKLPSKEKYAVNCYECGEPTEVNFKPDGIRPIYCPKCFQEVRERLLHPGKQSDDVVEVQPTPAKALSLSEAMGRPPVTFDGKPLTKPERSLELNAQESRRLKNSLLVDHQPKPTPAQASPQPQGPKILQAGQVIKFH